MKDVDYVIHSIDISEWVYNSAIAGMEQLERARKKLKTAHEKLELDYINHTREQDELENKLLERFQILDEKKHTATVWHGDVDQVIMIALKLMSVAK